jgi:hypothetical protein
MERNILETQAINIFVFVTKIIHPISSYQTRRHHVSKDSNVHRVLNIGSTTAENPIKDMNVHLHGVNEMSMIKLLYNKKYEDLRAARGEEKENINVHLETFHFFENKSTKYLTQTNITSTHFFNTKWL